MSQFFTCDTNEIESKLHALRESATSIDEWTTLYVDDESGEKWHLTTYESNYHGGEVRILMHLPKLTVEELIQIALTSIDPNDIIGASLELSEREKSEKEDFREKLISRLLQIEISTLSDFERKRIKLEAVSKLSDEYKS